MDDEQATALARGTAKLAGQMITAAPPAIRIEAAWMLVRAVIQSDVKPEHQLNIFNDYVDKVRDHIVNDLNKGMGHVTEEANNERSHRRTGSRGPKKARRKPA